MGAQSESKAQKIWRDPQNCSANWSKDIMIAARNGADQRQCPSAAGGGTSLGLHAQSAGPRHQRAPASRVSVQYDTVMYEGFRRTR
jgi:hypothetical protein